MVEVVLDTNIYSNDSLRRTARFNALTRLAKAGKLRLHIPYVVQKEFLSQQTEQHEQLVNSISNGISELQRKISPDLARKLDGVKESFIKIQDDLVSYPTTDFTNWINEIKGKVHLVSELHGVQVIEDYFEGAPPFKSKKNRLDIPDSFIWQVISDLANQVDVLYVVVNDKKVRDACGNKKNIKAFESLDDFIKSDFCRLILDEENVKENTERLFKYLPSILSIRQEEIQERFIEILENTNVQDERLILNGSHTATIKTVEDLSKEIAIDSFTSAQYYGDGIIVIPFSTQIEITAEYELSSTEYYNMGLKRAEQILFRDLGEGHYLAEESFPLNVAGKLSVKVDAQKICFL